MEMDGTHPANGQDQHHTCRVLDGNPKAKHNKRTTSHDLSKDRDTELKAIRMSRMEVKRAARDRDRWKTFAVETLCSTGCEVE